MNIRIASPLAFAAYAFVATTAWATRPDLKNLPIGLAPHERPVASDRNLPMTDPPEGHVRSLAEWEEAEAVMTLWPNASYMKALADHGPIRLLADTEADRDWWKRWFSDHGISFEHVDFFVVPTDSIWVRDYGPWFILDGAGRFGIVDTKYNRPRPKDDEVPVWLSQELGLPLYQPGLVHTGGNYYNDGLDNGFSSTLVFSENASLSETEVRDRMAKYLGIANYTTSKLAPGVTIEHMDTFGKLVAPDTWVFSDFPEDSQFRADSEAYVAKLRTMRSPYGTPYRIFRLKMRPVSGNSGERYRAYINSFISNKALYFPSYGDAVDDEVKRTYQEALPGYDIVPVENGGTEWGDSVHCRSRNLLKRDTIFLFPTVDASSHEISVEAYPRPGQKLAVPPQLCLQLNGATASCHAMALSTKDRTYTFTPNLTKGDKAAFWVEAFDEVGAKKIFPPAAPTQSIAFEAE